MAKIIILTIVAIIILSMVLSIIEDQSIRTFSTYFFKIGIPVYRQTIQIGDFNFSPEERQVFTKEEGVFFFADDGKIYFRSQNKVNLWRVHTPFPFKGMATIENMYQLKIVAKLPLGASLFFIFTGILLSGLSFIFGSSLAGLFALVFITGIFVISYTTEKQRMNKMVDELKEIFATFKPE